MKRLTKPLLKNVSTFFGELQGLPNEETLPSILQKEWQDYNLYNFAFIGGSPHQSLYFYDKAKPENFVTPSNGLYLYVFFTNHISRWHSSPMTMSWQNGSNPIYKKSGDEYQYAHPTNRLPRFKFYEFMREIGIAQFFANISNSPLDNYIFSDEQLESFADAILAIKKRYLDRFPKGKFVFLFHPLGDDRPSSLRLNTILNRKGIITFDPVANFLKIIKSDGFKTDKFQIKHDGHPNKIMNQWLADWIGLNIIKTDYRN